MAVELLILVDDAAASAGLKNAHGLAVLIVGPGRRMLFDTGPGDEILTHNAESLGVDLAAIDGLIVSHGHCDHTGGLAGLAGRRRGLDVYAHPGMFSRRWLESPGQPIEDISCPHSVEKLCELGVVFHEVETPEMLAEWMLMSGSIGGPKHGREVFVVRKGDDLVVDGFEDENVLMIRGEQGWAVITGCCHRGLKNTLRAAKFLTHDGRIAAIVGGLHLQNACREELSETVELLGRFDSPELYPCHCTGQEATDFLEENLPGKVHPVKAGARIVF